MMPRGIDGDDPFEDEEYRRRVEEERRDRAREKASIEINTVHVHVPTPEQALAARLEMACLRCGAGMLRGTQCRRCGAWCR